MHVLKIETRREGDQVLLRLDGSVVAETIPALARAIDELEVQGVSELHLDFAAVAFVDSRGVGALTGWHRHFGQREVDFRLLGLHGDPLNVLRISNLTSLLNVGPKPKEVGEILRDHRRALWISHEYAEQALSALGEGLIGLNSEGATLLANPALEAMLGVSEGDLLGLPFHKAFRVSSLQGSSLKGEEIRPEDSPFLAAARGEGRPFHGNFLIQATGERKPVPVRAVAAPIRRDGKPAGAIIGLMDIADCFRLIKASRVASRLEASAQLASGISHTLNNLMVGVLSEADSLRVELAGRTEAMARLDQIAAHARRADELTQLLLLFAREEKPQPRILALNDIIRHIVASLREMPVSAAAQIDVDLDDGLWTVEADAAQMSQLALALALNAVEAGAGKGKARLATRNVEFKPGMGAAPPGGLPPGRYVLFEVEDDGKGLNDEELFRVFEPFYSTKGEGRGLGLSAAQGIARSHGGELFLARREGRGAIASAYLPAAERDVEKVVVAPAPEGGTETILVADDDDLVRSVSRAILERMGYRVLTANTADEALKLVRAGDETIHLLILDMVMPGTSSVQAFPHFRQACPGMKVILCSGYAPDVDFEALLDLGASAFVSKPYTPDGLAAEVRRALDS